MNTKLAHHYVNILAKVTELAGLSFILIGILLAIVDFLCAGPRTHNWRGANERHRSNLGWGMLLGLELLVGADIVSTMTAPLTFESVGLLGSVVAIGALLQFSLETESEGYWPWQRARRASARVAAR